MAEMCIWDPAKECDCPMASSSILRIGALLLAVGVGGESLRKELSGYGCRPAKEAAPVVEEAVAE